MARIEVPMPQMGESIAEGTVSKWLKQVGDDVGRDEALLEISTDKVDAEIPSPAAGTLAEIVVQEGSTVEVGTVVAVIETEKGAAAAKPAAAPSAPAAAEEKASATAGKGASDNGEAKVAGESPTAGGNAKTATAAPVDGREESADDRLRRKSTPLVRRIAAEHDVDIADIDGTGHAGRVTKQDIMSFIEKGGKPAAKPAAAGAAGAKQPQKVAASGGPSVTADSFWETFYGQVRHPEFPVCDSDDVVPMDRIRRLTADHMVRAKRIAPHVHSFSERKRMQNL
jgi:2-oxoglutarate dehydrogenase E2 component (dihydrolipoamide succinyltransferase)